MGLSNEVLYILAAQGSAKQLEVKVGDTKKNPGFSLRNSVSLSPGPAVKKRV